MPLGIMKFHARTPPVLAERGDCLVISPRKLYLAKFTNMRSAQIVHSVPWTECALCRADRNRLKIPPREIQVKMSWTTSP